MGSANKNIHLKVLKGAGLLKKIGDVVDEIGIIKRVLDGQALAMKNIQRWRSQNQGSDGAMNKAKYMHYPLERFTRLEHNARSVQNSVRGLSILQAVYLQSDNDASLLPFLISGKGNQSSTIHAKDQDSPAFYSSSRLSLSVL